MPGAVLSLSASVPPALLVMAVEQLLHAVFHVCIVAQKHDVISVTFCISTGVVASLWLSSDVTEMHKRVLMFRISAFYDYLFYYYYFDFSGLS